MPLQAEQIPDVLIASQKQLGRAKFVDIAPSLQEYVAMPNLVRKEKVGFGDGNQIQFQVKVAQTGNARHMGLYEEDDINEGDTLKQALLPWRHSTSNYSFDEFEMMVVAGESEVLDLMKSRRHDCMTDLAELMETAFWSLPSSGSTQPLGIPYYVVKSASASTFTSLTGGHPSGYSDVAGLSRTTYGNWKNYAAPYTNVSRDDLFRAWRKAATATKFKPPVDYPSYNRGSRYGYYTNYGVIGPAEEELENRSDSLGNDVASKDGTFMFRRTPVTWVPKLENDTDNPVYGLNWGWLRPIFHKKRFMKETPPQRQAGQHTVYAIHIDLSWNLECRNCREQFVLSKGTSGTV